MNLYYPPVSMLYYMYRNHYKEKKHMPSNAKTTEVTTTDDIPRRLLGPAAAYLGITPQYLTKLMAWQSGPKGFKDGKHLTAKWIFYEDDLDAYLARKGTAQKGANPNELYFD